MKYDMRPNMVVCTQSELTAHGCEVIKWRGKDGKKKSEVILL